MNGRENSRKILLSFSNFLKQFAGVLEHKKHSFAFIKEILDTDKI